MPSLHKRGAQANRAADMQVFVMVVERGSFSAAARSLGMTPSAVSKLIQRLEARLGVQLVRRSTHRFGVTPEGREFYERSREVLASLDEAESRVSSPREPRGRVSINANVPFGLHVLLPLVPKLIERYPGLLLDVTLTDKVIDLVEERVDIAIRWGKLKSSDLIARRLGETTQAIVASPAYLQRHGTPRNARDLEGHNRLSSNYVRSARDWPLRSGRRLLYVPPCGTAIASDGEALRVLVLSGLGLARLSLFHIRPDIEAGRLVPVLEHLNPRELEPLHAMYLGRAGRLPSRVTAVLDFLEAHALVES